MEIEITMDFIKEMAICDYVYYSIDEMLEKFKELIESDLNDF